MRDWSARFAVNMQDYAGYSIGKQLARINDPDLISLAGGLPSPETFLIEEMRQFSEECLARDASRVMQYSPIRGEPELMEALIEYLERDSIRVGPENLLITSSGQQGLDLVGRLFLDPGDPVVVERPTFAGALAAFRMQRPAFLGVDLKPDGLDLNQLEDHLVQGRRKGREPKFLYVVPDFQNPSGISMGLSKRRDLLDLCARFELLIIEDSPYRHLRYQGPDLPSLYQLDQENSGSGVVGVQTFSKLFCPGVRVGYSMGPPEIMDKMTNIKEGGTLNTPKYNQDLCCAFLRQVDLKAHVHNCRRLYKRKLDVFQEALGEAFSEASGLTWTAPEGGLFVWMTGPEELNTSRLFQRALHCKVAFVPGAVCYGEHPEERHMRLNFSYPDENRLQEAVTRLSECLHSWQGQ